MLITALIQLAPARWQKTGASAPQVMSGCVPPVLAAARRRVYKGAAPAALMSHRLQWISTESSGGTASRSAIPPGCAIRCRHVLAGEGEPRTGAADAPGHLEHRIHRSESSRLRDRRSLMPAVSASGARSPAQTPR